MTKDEAEAVLNAPRSRGRPTLHETQLRQMAKNVLQGILTSESSGRAIQPSTKAEESVESVIKRVSERMQWLERFTHACAQGTILSFIASGETGIGKTYMIEEILGAYKESGKSDFLSVSGGKISTIELYKLLYRMRGKKNVLVLDDIDSVFDNEDSMNILKKALDTSAERKISYLTNATQLQDENGNDIPPDHRYEGSIIFLTNFDFEKAMSGGTAQRKLVPHFQALVGRTNYLDLKLHSRREVSIWVQYRVRTLKILQRNGLSDAQSEKVLAYMHKNSDKIRSLSIRTAVALAGYIKAWGHDWEAAANTFQLRQG